jgi:hypothetical protein
LVCWSLAIHPIPSKFLFRLRGAEQIRGEFRAAHVGEDLLALLGTLMRVNIFGSKSAVQTFVPVVLKDSVIQRRFNTGFACRCTQRLIVMHQLSAKHKTALILRHAGERLIIPELLPPGLKGEVGLPVGNYGLRWIAVLNDEVTRIPRECVVGYRTLRPRSKYDHFGDFTEMVANRMSRPLARNLRFLNHLQEIAPVLIVQ